MRTGLKLLLIIAAFAAVLLLAATVTEAQPGGKKGGKGGGSETVDEFVAKLMAFNKAKDGKLTKTDLTDKRLLDLFDRADANKDGVVTRAELEALYQRENLPGGGFGGGDKGKGDKKDKKGFGEKFKDGFKGKDGFGKFGPPQPGQLLSPFQQESLNLTEEQRKKIADLQKDVDAKLDQILTAEQKTQLRDMGKKGFLFGDKKGPFGDKKGPFGK
jgi:Spy/CpxP family protein refolding chaperone